MPTSVKVSDLKINRLTEAQYDAAVQAGVIGENELSIITDLEAGQVIQVDTLPTASADELDKIYQYIGTTDQDYTNGYFYKCVSDGGNPATYSWERVDVQPAPVIPDPLPSQSGNAGKFLTTDGTDASWGDALTNTANDPNNKSITIGGTSATWYGTNIGIDSKVNNAGVAVGYKAQIESPAGVAIGSQSKIESSSSKSVAIGSSSIAKNSNVVLIGADSIANGDCSIAIGYTAGYDNTAKYKVQIGYHSEASAIGAYQFGYGINNEAGTVCFALNTNGLPSIGNWTNYKLLDSDGTIPEARLADTTSATQGQILTLDSNGNAIWANPASPVVTPQTMPELTVNGWTTDPNTGDITQTVTVQGVTATNTVFVSPYPSSATDYADAGIICVSQSTNSLTFTCTTQPSNAITVNVLII